MNLDAVVDECKVYVLADMESLQKIKGRSLQKIKGRLSWTDTSFLRKIASFCGNTELAENRTWHQ